MLAAANIPHLHSRPTTTALDAILGKPQESPSGGSFWMNVGIAVALVALGGIFAGLTLGYVFSLLFFLGDLFGRHWLTFGLVRRLMGQDEIYLQVIEQSGEGAERNHARKVLRLLKRGKHWVLVTLLLSNVITNETLPIVLDRSLGGGWPAVLSSTVLIGEFPY